ncbi:hypothetical protein [Gottfriedia sp. OAE603]|uniref:hypothetical protein n=1 Tax=Gottfriedia sp. OAE603 TaxID=2663872 RepID=UPI0019E481A4
MRKSNNVIRNLFKVSNSNSLRKEVMEWNFIGHTYNDSFILKGIDIFEHDWDEIETNAKVIDPIYGVEKRFSVYKINPDGQEIIFAAGEFSYNVWGIYVRK